MIEKLADIRTAAIQKMKSMDKGKVLNDRHLELLGLLVEFELNAMTGDLTNVFTKDEQKALDINEIHLIVLSGMKEMTEMIHELKKDKVKWDALKKENEKSAVESLQATLSLVAPNLLKGVDPLKLADKIEELFSPKSKKKSVVEGQGLPVFATGGPLDKHSLN